MSEVISPLNRIKYPLMHHDFMPASYQMLDHYRRQGHISYAPSDQSANTAFLTRNNLKHYHRLYTACDMAQLFTVYNKSFEFHTMMLFFLPLVGPQKTITCLDYGEALPVYESWTSEGIGQYKRQFGVQSYQVQHLDSLVVMTFCSISIISFPFFLVELQSSYVRHLAVITL